LVILSLSSLSLQPEDQLFTEPRTGKTNANTSAEEAAADVSRLYVYMALETPQFRASAQDNCVSVFCHILQSSPRRMYAQSMDYTEFLGKFLRTVELTNLTRYEHPTRISL
jgi:hypothetical protein